MVSVYQWWQYWKISSQGNLTKCSFVFMIFNCFLLSVHRRLCVCVCFFSFVQLSGCRRISKTGSKGRLVFPVPVRESTIDRSISRPCAGHAQSLSPGHSRYHWTCTPEEGIWQETSTQNLKYREISPDLLSYFKWRYPIYTVTEIMSFWPNFRHHLNRKFWQLPVYENLTNDDVSVSAHKGKASCTMLITMVRGVDDGDAES